MSGRFMQSYVATGNSKLNELELLADLALSYPEIAEALRGQEGNGNGTPHIPAMRLSIEIRDGALKWGLFGEDSAYMFFGTVKDVKRPLDSIEADLAAGTWDKVPKKPRDSGHKR
jgi:hypothetical protein